ncbi:glycosyltransferase family 2 protein [Schaalia sp. lx-100]|uniref:glycosyltransferase family 2 protein n=1 Tax=Schaalia sp. lx-100 TaxID=2899081 RepID=UPI001E361878|nr:glycosyltransferase family 2 protein [Schaalia sp. lx-100]MCD4557555.1 glycosyltransferase [Schaalia sp. lx-100]
MHDEDGGKTMSSPTISIIMPVYGVENFIARAIESVQAQTCQDFEFLIVDDGSKDASGTIADRYAMTDSRITVFHNQNGGAPAARNFALDRAVGKYVYFMDGDDWAEPTMLADMLTIAEDNQAQLVVAGFYIDTYYSQSRFHSEIKSVPTRYYVGPQDFRMNAHQLFDANLLYTPWNKLFLRSYLEDHSIRFTPTFWDDFPFVLDVIRNIDTVCVTEKSYYHFIRARAESETAKYRPGVTEKRIEEDRWMQDLYRHWEIENTDAQEMIARRYIERLFGCFENILSPQSVLKKTEQRKEIAELLQAQRTIECLRIARPQSTYSRIMWLPLRWKSVPLIVCEGKLISFVKRHFTKLFAVLKANR